MEGGRLYGEVLDIEAVTPELVDRLYELYSGHYDGAHPGRFRADLAEKRWVLLLRDGSSGQPVGFSTQRLIDVSVEGRPVRALFSGDTIIHRDYWGSQELVRLWCRFAGGLKAGCADRPLYWFLISKGYRTYLYLPLFFREFYPRWERPVVPTFEGAVLQALAAAKYPEEFDPGTGLISPPEPRDRLRPELDGARKRAKSPHVDYFLRRNPRYQEGIELACLAEISPENMRSLARRELEAGMAASR